MGARAGKKKGGLGGGIVRIVPYVVVTTCSKALVDFRGLFICYSDDNIVSYATIRKTIAICGGLTPLLPYLDWTIFVPGMIVFRPSVFELLLILHTAYI